MKPVRKLLGMMDRISGRAEATEAANFRYAAFAGELKRLADDMEDEKLIAFLLKVSRNFVSNL